MRYSNISYRHLLKALNSRLRRVSARALTRSADRTQAGPEHCAETGAENRVTKRTVEPGKTKGVFHRCPGRRRQMFARPVTTAVLIATAYAGMLATPATIAQQADAVVAEASLEAQVDINTATADELSQRLRGVGASKAEAIVRYREQFGRFTSIEELAEVTGIGAATIERNRDVIRLQ